MDKFWWLILANVAWLFAIFDSLKRFERYIIKYAKFSLFDKKQSKLDKIVLAIFRERKGRYSKFVFYSFKYEMVLAIIQIPLLIWIYISKLYLNKIFFTSYLVSLLVLVFWPNIVANVFRMIYYFRSKKSEHNAVRSKEKI